MKKIAIFIVIICSLTSNAIAQNLIYITNTKVKELKTYNTLPNGDIKILTENNTSGCLGFWLDKRDAGYDSTLSNALAALHADTPIDIEADSDQLWSGSTGAFCHIYFIRSKQ